MLRIQGSAAQPTPDRAASAPPGAFPGTEHAFTEALRDKPPKLVESRFRTRPLNLLGGTAAGTKWGGEAGYSVGKHAWVFGPAAFMMSAAAGTLVGGAAGAVGGLAFNAADYVAPRLGNLAIDAVNMANDAIRGVPAENAETPKPE